MKEFHFYCLREEWLDFLRDVIEVNDIGCIFSEWYHAFEAPIYLKVNEQVIEKISRKFPVFLVGAFTIHGIHLHTHESGPLSGQYAVSLQTNGPFLELYWPADYEEDKIRRLVSGNLGYQTEWYSPDLKQRWPASPELKQAFRAVRDTIKKRLLLVNPKYQTWVSHAALDLVDSNQAMLRVNGQWIGKEHIVRRS